MERRIMVALCVVLGLGCLGGATNSNGVAVLPNGAPPPGLVPNSVCYPACIMPEDMVAADFNQDGWLDLAVSCSVSGQVLFYFNSSFPGGVFAPIVALNAPGTLPGATYLVAGTIGGYNGSPDLAVIHSPTAVKALTSLALIPTPAPATAIPFAAPGTGTPAFAAPGGVPTPLLGAIGGVTVVGLAAGNLNNDNVSDLVYITSAGGTTNEVVALVSGTGLGGVALPGWPPAPAPAPAAVCVADFDQNAWDDVAVVASDGTLYVWFYNPAATPPFGAPLVVPAAKIPKPSAIAAGDFDGDGFPDIVVVGTDSVFPWNGFAEVFVNNIHQEAGGGAGSFFSLGPMSTWGFQPRDVAVFDADGNGRDDFAVANWGSATVTVFLSDAQPLINDERNTRQPCLNTPGMHPDRVKISFQLFKYDLRCGFLPVALAAGDFDRNGKQDLAVALQSLTKELCAQNASCIEVIYDVACGFTPKGPNVPGQSAHTIDPNKESTTCPTCKPDLEAGSSGK